MDIHGVASRHVECVSPKSRKDDRWDGALAQTVFWRLPAPAEKDGADAPEKEGEVR